MRVIVDSFWTHLDTLCQFNLVMHYRLVPYICASVWLAFIMKLVPSEVLMVIYEGNVMI